MTLKMLLEEAKNKKKEPACIWTIAEKLEIYDSLSNPETVRLEEVWISHWLCTDTQVGEKAYFFDGNLVAYSYQSARKSDEQIKWVSRDAYSTVKSYLESLRERDEFIPILSDEELEESHGDHYHVDCASELLPRTQLYSHEGVSVEFIRLSAGAQAYSSDGHFWKNGEDVVLKLSEVNIAYFNKDADTKNVDTSVLARAVRVVLGRDSFSEAVIETTSNQSLMEAVRNSIKEGKS